MLRLVCTNSVCGRRYKTEERHAHNRLACPTCGCQLATLNGVPVPIAPPQPHRIRDLVDGMPQQPAGRLATTAYVQFTCEHCGAASKATAAKVGQTAICPKCRQPTRIVAVMSPVIPPQDAASGHAARARTEGGTRGAETHPEVGTQAKREAETRTLREAEQRAKREAEEKAQREAEQRARCEAEAQAQREAEECAKREAQERTQLEDEQHARWVETIDVLEFSAECPSQPHPYQVVQAIRNGSWRRNRFGVPAGQLLSQPLGRPLWGRRLGADLFAKNGFRFLRLPATATAADVSSRVQELHERWARNRKGAQRAIISAGYEPVVSLGDLGGYLAELKKPRARLVLELFWPHLAGEAFETLVQTRTIASWRVYQAFGAAADRAMGRERILAIHGQAITAHCLALVCECGYASGKAAFANTFWRLAMEGWEQTLAAEEFWDYFGERAEASLGSADGLDELRSRLPYLLLGFHSLFAQAYALAGDDGACQRHLSLLGQSSLSASACPDAGQAAALSAYW